MVDSAAESNPYLGLFILDDSFGIDLCDSTITISYHYSTATTTLLLQATNPEYTEELHSEYRVVPLPFVIQIIGVVCWKGMAYTISTNQTFIYVSNFHLWIEPR